MGADWVCMTRRRQVEGQGARGRESYLSHLEPVAQVLTTILLQTAGTKLESVKSAVSKGSFSIPSHLRRRTADENFPSPPITSSPLPSARSLFSLPPSRLAELHKDVAKIQSAAGSSGKIALYSPQYYYTCALGGVIACGTTHALVTPLDLVKCRKQVRFTDLL